MKTLFLLLSRILASVLLVVAGVYLATAVISEPPPHQFLNMGSEGVWTSLPTRVDPKSSTFDRVLPPPDPFPLKFHAGLNFRVLDSASFQVNGVQYQLVGAPVVARKKICRKADGKKYACGLNAFKALDNAMRGRLVECATEGTRDNKRLAQCRVNGRNVLALL